MRSSKWFQRKLIFFGSPEKLLKWISYAIIIKQHCDETEQNTICAYSFLKKILHSEGKTYPRMLQFAEMGNLKIHRKNKYFYFSKMLFCFCIWNSNCGAHEKGSLEWKKVGSLAKKSEKHVLLE
jgi:hypothetical protein